MHLYIIRHAQSANNALYARTGGDDGRVADPPLTELGHHQARLLAQFVITEPRRLPEGAALVSQYATRHDRRGFELTHLYCSLMTRAIQTGRYLSEATGLPLVAWPDVHERGGLHQIDEVTGEEVGVPGPNRAWFAAEYPQLVLPPEIGDAGWWNRPMEVVEEAIPRAHRVWKHLLERHGSKTDRVAVVTHGGFFQALMSVLLNVENGSLSDPFHAFRVGYGMSNVSISRLEIDDGFVGIRYLNRIDFLPDELITG